MADKEDEVIDVEFLTPVKITILCGEEKEKVVVNATIDVANRKIYHVGSETPHESLSEQVFTYLDSVNILPEDFFAAGEDIYERASGAYEDLQKTQESQMRGI